MKNLKQCNLFLSPEVIALLDEMANHYDLSRSKFVAGMARRESIRFHRRQAAQVEPVNGWEPEAPARIHPAGEPGQE